MKTFFAWLGIVTGLLGFVCNLIWPTLGYSDYLWPLTAALWAFCCLIERRIGALLSRQSFVQGARWWEWQKTGATMWHSDQSQAYEHAEWLDKQGKLGHRD